MSLGRFDRFVNFLFFFLVFLRDSMLMDRYNSARGKEMGSDAKVADARDDVANAEVGWEGTKEEDQDEATVS